MQVSPQAKLAQAVAVGCCRSALGLFSVCAALLPPDAAACRPDGAGGSTFAADGTNDACILEQRSLTMRRVLVSAVRLPALAWEAGWVAGAPHGFRSHRYANLCLRL